MTIEPDSRHWRHGYDHLLPGPDGTHPPPVSDRPGTPSHAQSREFQAFQTVINDVLEDARDKLTDRYYAELLDIVGRRVSLLTEKL